MAAYWIWPRLSKTSKCLWKRRQSDDTRQELASIRDVIEGVRMTVDENIPSVEELLITIQGTFDGNISEIEKAVHDILETVNDNVPEVAETVDQVLNELDQVGNAVIDCYNNGTYDEILGRVAGGNNTMSTMTRKIPNAEVVTNLVVQNLTAWMIRQCTRVEVRYSAFKNT
ncbi:hypothetical protein DOTSEDRAFT_80033 [Dothistroma septosporum NZE10]|uniref:Uncharacterized protein n=1 Tax=Dothistroma septosporum (strain NZE10 / CBS 128990) TaxID=675120 RepID=N1PPA5_DOTSN|nr:hypothetical protein DOTSEDRAFT_80033 [Dothistroma septosporum NZE10]